MINPCMATMLCFVFTDAAIEKQALGVVLKRVVGKTFNCISVDGETSTNDSVFLLASGAAQNKPFALGSGGIEKFESALFEVCKKLALEMVSDGEGASKVMQVTVKGAFSEKDASTAAGAIANSLLVKTALFGGDPNWGRIASSVGASGAQMEPHKTSVSIGGVLLFKNGEPTGKEAGAALKMKESAVEIEVELGIGKSSCTKWGCDLSHAYVDVNSKYGT